MRRVTPDPLNPAPELDAQEPEYFVKFLEYIKNAGGAPRITWFDEDWVPVGPLVRKALVWRGEVYELDGCIMLNRRKHVSVRYVERDKRSLL